MVWIRRVFFGLLALCHLGGFLGCLHLLCISFIRVTLLGAIGFCFLELGLLLLIAFDGWNVFRVRLIGIICFCGRWHAFGEGGMEWV
jgi:hypothetical protein